MNTNYEHLHVMFNHLPMVGLLASVVPLLVGLIFKSRASLNAGLLLVVVCAAATYGVVWTGDEAHERFEDDAALAAVLDGPGHDWTHEHEERADIASWVTYGTGLVGLIALGLSVKRAGKGRKLAMLTLAGVAVSVGFMGWTADAGGKIRHPEFRDGFSAQNPAGTGPAEHADDGDDDDHHHGDGDAPALEHGDDHDH